MPHTATRNKILSDLWASPELSAAIGKMKPAELQDDLRQELFVVLCKMEQGKLIGLHERNELRWFAVRTLMNMAQSDRSTFFIEHRRYREDVLSSTYTIAPSGGLAVKSKINDGLYVGDMREEHVNQPEGLIHHDLTEPGVNWLEQVSDAVEALDPYEADMLRLYVRFGKNCKPIAEATGIQVTSVRYVVRAAKKKVREVLKQSTE